MLGSFREDNRTRSEFMDLIMAERRPYWTPHGDARRAKAEQQNPERFQAGLFHGVHFLINLRHLRHSQPISSTANARPEADGHDHGRAPPLLNAAWWCAAGESGAAKPWLVPC